MNARSRRVARSRPRVESLEGRQMLTAAGTLDPSFGAGSGVVAGFGGLDIGHANAVAAQPDGKIVVAGITTLNSSTDELTVARLDADGGLDTTFGQGGRVILARSASSGDTVGVESVLIQPDGKIVVAGQDTIPSTTSGGLPTTILRDAVFRLGADGSPDSSFGTSGEVAFNNGANPQFPRIAAAALGTDGKIVLAGVAGFGTANETVAAARLDADGSLDSTFGGGGTVTTPLVINGFSSPLITSVAIQADDKVVVGGFGVSYQSGNFMTGTQDFEAAVIRFDADGALDTSFGGASAAGKLLIPPDPANPTALGQSTAEALTIQPDGKIVVAGTATGGADVVTRLGSDGTYDLGFGTAAQTFVPSEFNGSVNSLIVQADGRIVLSGTYVPTSASQSVRLARFNADGTLDQTFGNASTPGITVFSLGSGTSDLAAAAAQADGRIVVAGSIYSTGSLVNQQYAVARVLTGQPFPANLQAPADFDGDGKSDIAAYLSALGEFAYRPSGGGADVLVPFGIPGAGQTLPAIGDYTGAGHAEIAAYIPSQGLYAYRPADGGPDVVEPFGIAGAGQSIPAVGDYTGSGKDDVAIYLPSLGAFAIRPAGGGPDRIIPFGLGGLGGSIPAPGDYDGDGKTDLAVYLPSLGEFAYRPSSGGADVIVPFGIAGAGKTLPAPGDYDGSGRTEIAAYLPTLGIFAYRPAGGGSDVVQAFGTAGDGTIPIAGDFSGSGHDDVAIYDPNYAAFAYRPSSGADVVVTFGQASLSNSVPVGALPTASTPASALAAAIAPGAAAPASSSRSVSLASAERRVGKATVVAQSGTDLSGRPTA